MAYGATAGAGAAAAAATADAIKASGAIVKVDPDNFVKLVSKATAPLVVIQEGGFLSSNFHYLFGYKGLAFYCKSAKQLSLPGDAEIVAAKKIWIPG